MWFTLQQRLESMRVVKAYGRQDLEEMPLGDVSRATSYIAPLSAIALLRRMTGSLDVGT